MPRKRRNQHSYLALSAAALALLAMLLAPAIARAGYTVTLQQVGTSVVANGNGSLDLSNLIYSTLAANNPGINPAGAYLMMGTDTTNVRLYSQSNYASFTGPTQLGATNFFFTPGTIAGQPNDFVGITASTYIEIADTTPFIPGTQTTETLTSSDTYTNTTIAGLGLTPGTYEWSWGTGANQNFTLDIGGTAAPVPEPPAGVFLGIDFLCLMALGLVLRNVVRS